MKQLKYLVVAKKIRTFWWLFRLITLRKDIPIQKVTFRNYVLPLILQLDVLMELALSGILGPEALQENSRTMTLLPLLRVFVGQSMVIAYLSPLLISPCHSGMLSEERRLLGSLYSKPLYKLAYILGPLLHLFAWCAPFHLLL